MGRIGYTPPANAGTWRCRFPVVPPKKPYFRMPANIPERDCRRIGKTEFRLTMAEALVGPLLPFGQRAKRIARVAWELRRLDEAADKLRLDDAADVVEILARDEVVDRWALVHGRFAALMGDVFDEAFQHNVSYSKHYALTARAAYLAWKIDHRIDAGGVFLYARHAFGEVEYKVVGSRERPHGSVLRPCAMCRLTGKTRVRVPAHERRWMTES